MQTLLGLVYGENNFLFFLSVAFFLLIFMEQFVKGLSIPLLFAVVSGFFVIRCYSLAGNSISVGVVISFSVFLFSIISMRPKRGK